MSPRRDTRTKRERFLPHAYERFGMGLRVRRCTFDGERVVDEIDAERHVVETDEETWDEVAMELEVTTREQVVAGVFPEHERRAPPAEVWVVVRCPESRLRRGERVGGEPPVGAPVVCELRLRRDELRGSAEIVPFLIRSRDADRPVPGFAPAAGARLASARGWELRVDRKRETPGKFLAVLFRSFREDDRLRAYASNLYHLDSDVESPILWINADHDKVRPVLEATGTTGKRARLREVFFDQIAHAVWTQLFARAAGHLVEPGELVYEWETSVLHELLPAMYPSVRNHDGRVEMLVRALDGGRGAPDVLEQLDHALQRKNEIATHMTRLVEEAVERGGT
ncbi:MAG: hypothetical protein ACOCUS_05515 [Polyangiales bacterium]